MFISPQLATQDGLCNAAVCVCCLPELRSRVLWILYCSVHAIDALHVRTLQRCIDVHTATGIYLEIIANEQRLRRGAIDRQSVSYTQYYHPGRFDCIRIPVELNNYQPSLVNGSTHHTPIKLHFYRRISHYRRNCVLTGWMASGGRLTGLTRPHEYRTEFMHDIESRFASG